MKFWKKLFGTSGEPLAHLRVAANQFAKTASTGPAWSRLPIKDIPAVIAALNTALQQLKVPTESLFDLYDNTLLGVCPRCNQYCAGKAFSMMPLLSVSAQLMFTRNSGGFERMLQGTCLNYSCSAREFDLFWAPDLDSQMLGNLRDRGINLDPHTQRKRDHVWRPTQPNSTNPPMPARRIAGEQKIGRNDPCPCGSGNKYKNCCGRET